MSTTNIPNTAVTSLAVRLARANELNLKKILAKGEEVEDKDILDALVDPLHHSSLYVDEEKGCFVKVKNQNRVDKALETFTPVSESTLTTSVLPKTRKSSSFMKFNDSSSKWRSYIIDLSLVLAFLLIVVYGFTSS